MKTVRIPQEYSRRQRHPRPQSGARDYKMAALANDLIDVIATYTVPDVTLNLITIDSYLVGRLAYVSQPWKRKIVYEMRGLIFDDDVITKHGSTWYVYYRLINKRHYGQARLYTTATTPHYTTIDDAKLPVTGLVGGNANGIYGLDALITSDDVHITKYNNRSVKISHVINIPHIINVIYINAQDYELLLSERGTVYHSRGQIFWKFSNVVSINHFSALLRDGTVIDDVYGDQSVIPGNAVLMGNYTDNYVYSRDGIESHDPLATQIRVDEYISAAGGVQGYVLINGNLVVHKITIKPPLPAVAIVAPRPGYRVALLVDGSVVELDLHTSKFKTLIAGGIPAICESTIQGYFITISPGRWPGDPLPLE